MLPQIHNFLSLVFPLYTRSHERSQPFKFLLLGLEWILTEMIIELSRIRIWATGMPQPDYGETDFGDYSEPKSPTATEKSAHGKPAHRGKGAEGAEAEEYFRAKQEKEAQQVTKTYYPCDKQSNLYIMSKSFIKEEHAKSPKSTKTEARYELKSSHWIPPSSNFSSLLHRPFYVSPIRYSNLILIVIDQMSGSSASVVLKTEQEQLNPFWTYGDKHPCYKNYMNNLPRRRLDECFVSYFLVN
jgi:hypothetical protein